MATRRKPKTTITHWTIKVWWNDESYEHVGDVPDDVANAVDSFITEYEAEHRSPARKPRRTA